MATPNDAVPENRVQKKSAAKQKWHNFMGKVNEGHTPKALAKDPPARPPKDPSQADSSTQSQQPLVVAKQEPSKDDPEINELQQEYQRAIQRNMSSDTKNEGPESVPAATHESKSEAQNLARPIAGLPSMPKAAQLANYHGTIAPTSVSHVDGLSPMQQITHATLVTEPGHIENNRSDRRPRRPSGSQQPRGRIYDNAVTSNVQQRQDTPRKGQNAESYQALVSELDIAQFENQGLRRQLEEKDRLAHDQSLAIESLERTRSEMEAHLEGTKHAQERSDTTILSLQNEMEAMQADLMGWQRQFDMVNSELLQLRTDLDKHVNDKWFQSQWRDLNTKIEAMSIHYFVGRQSIFSGSILGRGKGARLDKLEIHPSISLTRLTNEHARYLGSEHDRPLIIQAFVWWVLVNRIFAHTACDEWGFFWAGQSRELLYHLKRQVLPPRPRDWHRPDIAASQRFETDARNYHNWRATTAMLLQARTSVDKRIKTIRDLIKDIVDDVCKALSPYIVPAKNTSPEAAEEGFRKQLETVLSDAIKIDAEMAQQRAWLYCEQWRARMEGDPLWGFACNPDEADVVQTTDQTKGRRLQTQGNCVELIVQPALLREGNQYGEEYLKQQVLCKAKVVLGETSLPSFQHR